jgi:hypothetical protein
MTAFPDPLVIASAHQKHMNKLVAEIRDNAGCIRQLLVGRDVRRKGNGAVYRITETRLNLSGVVEIRGKKGNAGRAKHIGTVAEIELAEVKP